ncbi:hypothetical protein Tco_0029279 [Tanacetum coccineum]
MATTTTNSLLISNTIPTHKHFKQPFSKHPFTSFTHKQNISPFLLNSKGFRSYVKPENKTDVVVEHGNDELHEENDDVGSEGNEEMDWKSDEEFKKFMGNPSIEAAIKLEKKRTDRKLKELDRESGSGGLINRVIRDGLWREKQRLEKAEETFKALDLNKLFITLLDYVLYQFSGLF